MTRVSDRAPLDRLDRPALRRWAVRARAALAEQREEIDALNVFPVPDGDTGTNMYLTLDSAVERTAHAAPEDELSTFARATVLGARGNSGVIVSQLVRGLVDVMARAEHPDGADAGAVAQAFRRASDLAYACVGEPTEGTILTVARSAAEAAEARARAAQASLSAVVDAALEAARAALARTPSQLAALRHAGVVDAGASGLVTVLDALKRVVDGADPGTATDGLLVAEGAEVLGVPLGEHVPPDYDGPRYELVHVVTGATEAALRDLRADLAPLGDSIVVAGGPDGARVHVHLDEPEAAQQLTARVGTVTDVTVTDLYAQAAAVRAADRAVNGPGRTGSGADTSGIGVVVCTDGEGLRELFAEEGAVVVTSSPGARASVGAIVGAATALSGRPVVILPNDGDVVLTAGAAASELEAAGREVLVLPTRSDLAGLAALSVLDRTSSLAEARDVMEEAISVLRTGALARASRDAVTTAGPCRVGDILGFEGDEIVLVAEAADEAAVRLVDRLLAGGGELLTLVTGEAGEALAESVEARVGEEHPDVEVVRHEGGQAAYLLLMGVE